MAYLLQREVDLLIRVIALPQGLKCTGWKGQFTDESTELTGIRLRSVVTQHVQVPAGYWVAGRRVGGWIGVAPQTKLGTGDGPTGL